MIITVIKNHYLAPFLCVVIKEFENTILVRCIKAKQYEHLIFEVNKKDTKEFCTQKTKI